MGKMNLIIHYSTILEETDISEKKIVTTDEA
jgi:hypothetical protein